MQVSEIIKICKKNKTLRILKGKNGITYISDYVGIYTLPDNLNDITKAEIICMYDIDESKVYMEELETPYDMESMADEGIEIVAAEENVYMIIGGVTVKAITDGKNAVFIDADYFKPLKKHKKDYITYTKRGESIIIKDGLTPIAQIAGMKIKDEKIIDTVSMISRYLENQRGAEENE